MKACASEPESASGSKKKLVCCSSYWNHNFYYNHHSLNPSVQTLLALIDSSLPQHLKMWGTGGDVWGYKRQPALLPCWNICSARWWERSPWCLGSLVSRDGKRGACHMVYSRSYVKPSSYNSHITFIPIWYLTVDTDKHKKIMFFFKGLVSKPSENSKTIYHKFQELGFSQSSIKTCLLFLLFIRKFIVDQFSINQAINNQLLVPAPDQA